MVKIRSYTCFVNRKHLNGRFRLVIPGVNSIDCVAFYDLIKITLKSIFQWNVTKFTLYKRINRRKGVQWIIAMPITATITIRQVIVDQNCDCCGCHFGCGCFVFTPFFTPQKFTVDWSRCISINKSIMLGLVRFDSIGLGWVHLTIACHFQKKIIIRIMYAYPIHTHFEYIWSQL